MQTMQLLGAVQTFAIAASASALVAAAASFPFTPVRYWSSRLRKHMETVTALGDDERYDSQREVLQVRAEEIAAKVAAATHIPTQWPRFAIGVVLVGFLAGFIATSVLILHQGHPLWYGLDPFTTGTGVMATIGYVYYSWVVLASLRNTRWHRRQFVDQGCPPDYPVPQPLWAAMVEASQSSEHDPLEPLRRKVSTWRLGRPWYRGGRIRPVKTEAVGGKNLPPDLEGQGQTEGTSS